MQVSWKNNIRNWGNITIATSKMTMKKNKVGRIRPTIQPFVQPKTWTLQNVRPLRQPYFNLRQKHTHVTAVKYSIRTEQEMLLVTRHNDLAYVSLKPSFQMKATEMNGRRKWEMSLLLKRATRNASYVYCRSCFILLFPLHLGSTIFSSASCFKIK